MVAVAEREKARTVEGTLEAIDFETVPTAVYDENGRKIEGYQRLMRPDSGKTLAIMSNKYKLVQHKEAMMPVVDILGSEGWQVKQSRIERFGAAAFVELVRRGNPVKIVGEKIGERIFMRNTYDGTSRLIIIAGAEVLACLNGATLPGKGAIQISHMHTGDVREQLNFLTGKMRKIEQGLAEQMIDAYSKLDSPVPVEIGREIVKRVVGERFADAPTRYWTHGIGRNGDPTAWNLYNGITQYLTHDFTGGWGRRERKNEEAYELIVGWLKTGHLPVERGDQN